MITSLIWGMAVMVLKDNWEGTVEHFVIATLFFAPVVIFLSLARNKIENKAARIVLLIIIIHISSCATFNLIGLIIEHIINQTNY